MNSVLLGTILKEAIEQNSQPAIAHAKDGKSRFLSFPVDYEGEKYLLTCIQYPSAEGGWLEDVNPTLLHILTPSLIGG